MLKQLLTHIIIIIIIKCHLLWIQIKNGYERRNLRSRKRGAYMFHWLYQSIWQSQALENKEDIASFSSAWLCQMLSYSQWNIYAPLFLLLKFLLSYPFLIWIHSVECWLLGRSWLLFWLNYIILSNSLVTRLMGLMVRFSECFCAFDFLGIQNKEWLFHIRWYITSVVGYIAQICNGLYILLIWRF